jgi:hypothetical protein
MNILGKYEKLWSGSKVMSDAYIHKNINTEKDTSGCRYD